MEQYPYADRAGALTMGEGTLPEVARLLAAQLAAFLAILLLASAAHKGMRFAHTRKVVQDFVGVPRPAAAAVAFAAVLGELLAAAAALVPAYRLAGASLAALIWGRLSRADSARHRAGPTRCGLRLQLRAQAASARSLRGGAKCGARGVCRAPRRIGEQRGAGGRLSGIGGVRALGAVRGARTSDGRAAAAPRSRGMSFVIASQIALWVALLVLGVGAMALPPGRSGYCISASRRPARWRCVSR